MKRGTRSSWRMVVVFVTGFSLAGYIANRLIGQKRGTIVTALIGGVTIDRRHCRARYTIARARIRAAGDRHRARQRSDVHSRLAAHRAFSRRARRCRLPFCSRPRR